MRTGLHSILAVALLAVLVSTPAAGLVASAQMLPEDSTDSQPVAGQGICLGSALSTDGKRLSYTAEEMHGSELVAFTQMLSERADVMPLLSLAEQQGYHQSGEEAYQMRVKATQQGQEIAFRFARLDFRASDETSSAQLVFFDFGDHVVTGLGLISFKPNGYKLIDVYEVEQGKAVLTSHIDAEAMAQASGAKETAASGQSEALQATPNPNCPVCQSICGALLGGGCGAGSYFACTAICAPIGTLACPIICAVVFGVICGGGGYFGCGAVCNELGFCP